MLTSVAVGFDDHPGGCVTYTQVEDLAGGDEVIEALHEFWDGGCEVPPVDEELCVISHSIHL